MSQSGVYDDGVLFEKRGGFDEDYGKLLEHYLGHKMLKIILATKTEDSLIWYWSNIALSDNNRDSDE